MERFDFDASLTMMERRGKRDQDKRASDMTLELLFALVRCRFMRPKLVLKYVR
jgi:hypothetical protein